MKGETLVIIGLISNFLGTIFILFEILWDDALNEVASQLGKLWSDKKLSLLNRISLLVIKPFLDFLQGKLNLSQNESFALGAKRKRQIGFVALILLLFGLVFQIAGIYWR